MQFCCEPMKEAYGVGVIHEDDTPPKHEEKLEGIFLKDRDCGVVDVKVPIKFCPYCGKNIIYNGRYNI